MCAACAHFDSYVDNCSVARFVNCMVCPVATVTIGPVDVGMTWRQCSSASGSR